ncbi:MAG: hypothetical protein D6762_00375 [Candidatus Neomarinimicrobiota bacterium]|nr:MAG: hypothetical protein D6762_00375 [Candidatus Neomarinimicrobiota bacterium]
MPFRFHRRLIVLPIFVLFLQAQTVTVTGVVLDSATVQPLPSVNLVLDGTTEGTVTDDDGRFQLETDQPLPFTLRVTHVGYETRELRIGTPAQTRSLRILLNPRVIRTPEITIVGSRSRAQQDVSSSTEMVSLQRVEQRGIRDAGEVLEEMESVSVTTTERGRQSLSIRGSNPDEVAVFLDGVKINHVATGVANLNFVDVAGLESVEVLKGGGSVMFGGGNFGGVVLLHSRSPETDRLAVKGSRGGTLSRDQDLSLAGSLQWRGMGIGGQLTGKRRLYDGRTLFDTQYANYSGQYSTLRQDWIYRHIDLDNRIEFPSGGVLTGDRFRVDRLEWNYRRSPKNGWSLEGGTTRWEWNDHFFSTLSRRLRETSRSAVINRAWGFRSLEGNVQWESNRQVYAGDQLFTNSQTGAMIRDTTRLQQQEAALATTIRYRGRTPADGIDEILLEGGYRLGRVAYQEEQHLLRLSGEGAGNQDTIQLQDQPQLATFRLGVAATTHWGEHSWSFFFNAGENRRLPNLADRLLWGIGRHSLEEEYSRLVHTVPVSPYQALILQEEIQQVKNILLSMDRGFQPEHVSLAEVSLRWSREWKGSHPVNRLEAGMSVFRNFYTNKVAYRTVADDLIVPYNTATAQLPGWELYQQLRAFRNRFSLKMSYTHLSPSDPAVFPGKAAQQARIVGDVHWSWGRLNWSTIWTGPEHYLVGGVRLQQLNSRSNTHLTVTLKKRLGPVAVAYHYTVRNLFSQQQAVLGREQYDPQDPFNYYDRHRTLHTLTVSWNHES